MFPFSDLISQCYCSATMLAYIAEFSPHFNINHSELLGRTDKTRSHIISVQLVLCLYATQCLTVIIDPTLYFMLIVCETSFAVCAGTAVLWPPWLYVDDVQWAGLLTRSGETPQHWYSNSCQVHQKYDVKLSSFTSKHNILYVCAYECHVWGCMYFVCMLQKYSAVAN